MRIEKILAPVDLSGTSGSTLHCAAALAGSFHASITVLYVGAGNADAGHRLEALAREQLDPLPFLVQVLPGDPAQTIIDAASAGQYGLIAMATHGYGPFGRLLLGSVTTSVLDKTNCPVLTGAHFENTGRGSPAVFGNLVCAVDLGINAERVVRWAGEFSRAVNGRLFLLHVVPKLGTMEQDYFRPDADIHAASRAHEDLEALRQKLALKATPLVVGGEIEEALRHQAIELRADVLIAGRGIAAGRLGRLRSQALKIIRAAPCPVITV